MALTTLDPNVCPRLGETGTAQDIIDLPERRSA